MPIEATESPRLLWTKHVTPSSDLTEEEGSSRRIKETDILIYGCSSQEFTDAKNRGALLAFAPSTFCSHEFLERQLCHRGSGKAASCSDCTSPRAHPCAR